MGAIVVERSMHASWLSNSWLVADHPGGSAVVIDTGAPPEPLLATVAELGLAVGHVLCTHHHHDHVAHNDLWRQRFGAAVCGHEAESRRFGRLDRTLSDGETVTAGELTVKAMHIPGHTVGQLAYLVADRIVFTGDTLFRGSVGGTRGPGHGTFEQLRHSIMDVLMALPEETRVCPGHSDDTTVGQEWRDNPFIRAWRQIDAVDEIPCVALGEEGTLLLRARDYDGGSKCWVRFGEDGRMDVVPGSRVQESGR